MTDPHTPSIDSFPWGTDDEDAVKMALAHTDPWNHEAAQLKPVGARLKDIKDRLRNFHMQRQHQTCCYCRANLAGGGHFMVDREHILPKSKFPALTYAPSNLSVSCKRCNMQYKHDNVDFVVDTKTVEGDHQNSARYLFVHPNLDDWSTHLGLRHAQLDDVVLVKYRIMNQSQKGKYTFEYFRLDRLEVELFDEAQGGPNLRPEVREKLLQLAKILEMDVP